MMQSYIFIMTKYAVEVWESYRKIVMVEADSEEEAEEFAEDMWIEDEIQFKYPENGFYSGTDFDDSKFICVGEYEE